MPVDKKLRECDFFLARMAEQQERVFGDREPFDFFLSAFLSAARSVDYRLRHQFNNAYSVWYESWESRLQADQRRLLQYLIDDRNVEVHEDGSKRLLTTEPIQAGNQYSDGSATLFVFGPPGATGVTLDRRRFYFAIGEANVPVIDACAYYLQLLKTMLTDFRATLSAS